MTASMNVNLCPETPADHDAIRDILIAAFADHPFSHQTEHLIVEGLRADNALTLSLVAELDGKVIGHIAFSAVTIGGHDCGWLGLGKPSSERQCGWRADQALTAVRRWARRWRRRAVAAASSSARSARRCSWR